MPVRSKRNWLLSAAGISALAVFSGLFLWWNTNLLGDDEFCDGAVTSAELASVLDTKGRLSATSSVGDSMPGFSCSVQRTSKFLGAAPMEIQMKTAAQEPDFQFQTHVWKNPSAMSFFSNGATGAVSGERGWVLLPEACRGKVSTFSPGGMSRQTATNVRTVEAVVKQGTVDRAELAKTLVKAAQRIADEAGCAAGGATEEPRLQAVSEAPTDPGSACGLAGFTLPPAALVKDEATLGKEQVSGSMPGTWACGMHLAGNTKGVIWFAASSDLRLVDRILLKEGAFEDLPGGAGVIERQQHAAVLTCGTGKIYVSMRWSTEYQRALYKRGISVSREMFQSFVDSAGKKFQCGAVQLPPS
ncbi:hypothetical protein [Streptomyces sp. TRM49041]|uniref:hypothetical protein n=1 Tax=Streptomyces sp. TRM49041 TaxID=2603216 RepID=UPI0011EF1312|nr:hypothetical protein [Streptomyces sp. TRM49041]